MNQPGETGGGEDRILAGSPAATVTVPLFEEQATLTKRDTVTGRVRVSTHTEVFEEVARATLEGEVVDVERVAIGQDVTGAPPVVRTEGDVTIVPILEEVLVVEKRLMLKEEVRIRRRRTSEVAEVPVQLRRQRAQIDE